MSTLYPRLLPNAASERWRMLKVDGPKPPPAGVAPSLATSVFAATGGQRVTAERLAGIRLEIVELANSAGMNSPINDKARSAFDLSVAHYLHTNLDISPGEASQRPVWSFFGLVLVPDVCAWRYPPRATAGYYEERFRCADVTRHALSKLWLRAHLLHEPGSTTPYSLVNAIGENDLDQIIARREDVAATPALVRAIVRAHREDTAILNSALSREVLRDSLKRLRRLAAFLNFDGRSTDELDQLVHSLRRESKVAMGSDSPSQTPPDRRHH